MQLHDTRTILRELERVFPGEDAAVPEGHNWSREETSEGGEERGRDASAGILTARTFST